METPHAIPTVWQRARSRLRCGREGAGDAEHLFDPAQHHRRQFTAIGGFSQVQLEYFNVQAKRYEPRDVNEQVEVISLIGNVALVDGKPYVHAHVSVGTRDYQARDGHLGEATVQPTLELFLTQLNSELVREQDPSTGLEELQP